MRKWLYEGVIAAPTQSDTFQDRVFSSGGTGGSDDIPDAPLTPFIVIRSATQIPTGIPNTAVLQQGWQVWVHDRPGSMLVIDEFLMELQQFLPTQVPQKVDDTWVTACEFLNASGDLPDEHYQTNTRYLELKITGNLSSAS